MELKKLLYKCLLGLMAYLLLAWGVRQVFDPSPFYGNDILEEKMKQFPKVADEYNSIFIGSSIILHNFDPGLFDEALPDSLGITTYNLGSGGTMPPETYDFYDKLMQQHPGNIRYVFFELRDIGLFEERHTHTLRKRYWMTPGEYGFIAKSVIQSANTDSIKWMNLKHYGVAGIERLCLVNYFNDLAGTNTKGREGQLFKQEQLKQNNTRGYLPLHDPSRAHQMFLQDTSMLYQIAGQYRAFRHKNSPANPAGAHIHRLLEIIGVAEAQGIRCFFILTPKHELEQMKETMRLASHIPERNLINVADPDKCPELYLACNSVSNSHFNEQGTQILSLSIAQEFLHKINLYPDSFNPNQSARTSRQPNN
jgi:hypothetical protein